MTFKFFGSKEVALLMAAAMAVAGVWGFAEIADEVLEGETLTFDERVVRSMRVPGDPSALRGPRWLHEVGRDVTALGSYTVLSLVVAVIGIGLLLRRRGRAAALVLTAGFGGGLLNAVLKSLFDRGRPDLPQVVYVTSSSFPSGHAMISTGVYLTLGALLAGMVTERRQKVYCLSVAMLIALLVGVSRVYLGAHYLTDVLAGWLAGSAWAMICLLAFRWLEDRPARWPPLQGEEAKREGENVK
jgi:undecaprenyl-diphosphatase